MQTPNKEGHKLPMLTPKNPDGSQRVIKQIMVIDPNKLRVAGLDLKMAEALKKAKGKMSSSSSSKDTKLAIAKSIVSKKIRQAQLSKESYKQTQNVTSQQLSSSISIQDAIRNLSFENPTTPKPQIKVANLKTLMPPPPAPVSSHPQTVLLSFLKSNKSDVVNTLLDSNKGNAPEPIPKASTKKLSAQQKRKRPPKNIESKVISSEVKFEMKKPKEVEAVAPKIIEIKVISPTKDAYSESPPHKRRPKVLESKVLSPEEKIDLSTLRVKAAPMLYSMEPSSSSPILNNSAPTNCCVKEISPKEVVPSEPVVESAVDFINNLSFMFEGTSERDSVLKNACGEDATSFLMSVFEQLPPKVPNSSTGSSQLAGTPDQSTSSNPIPLKMPEAVASDAVPSEKPPSLQKTNEQTVAIRSAAKVSDPPKEKPPKIVSTLKSKQSFPETSGAPNAGSSVHIDSNPVTQNNETAVESSLLGGATNEKKSPVKDDPTMLHLEDFSPSLPCETEQISSEEKPRAEEIPSPTSSAASARRKARKSVPVLIAKLNKNRKTAVLQEKQPEQVDGAPHTEDKPSKKLEELTKLQSEPPPQQEETSLEYVTEEKPLISASTPKPSIRRRSTKALPIVIAKLKPEMQKKLKPEKDSHPKSAKIIYEDTNEVDADNKSVTNEVIQKPLLAAYSRESQIEVTVATPVIVKEPFSESERQLQVKEVPIPRISKPSPELDRLAEDVVIKSRKISEQFSTAEADTKLESANKSTDGSSTRQNEQEQAVVSNETANVSRKTSESSKELKSVDSSSTAQKEHAIVQPAKVVAAVKGEEVPNSSKVPKETSVQTKGESATDSMDLQIQKPTQTQEKKEEKAAIFESITDTSQGSKTIDGSSESQGSTAELPAQNEPDLGKSTGDATLEKSDVTPLRSKKEKVSHAFCYTASHPASVDQNESLAVIKIAETCTRSRNSPERPRTAKAATSLKNTTKSSDTSHTRVESASTERDPIRQSSQNEEEIKAPSPTAKTRRSTTAKTSTKPDLDKEPLDPISKGESGNLVDIEPAGEIHSPLTTKGKGQRSATKTGAKSSELAGAPTEADDGVNEVPKTPASTRKSRSRLKSTAGLSSEKTTKIITEAFLKESESENSVQAQPPVRPRSTRAKGSNTLSDDKNPEKAIKVDSLKGQADAVPTTSKTRRRTKAEPSEELPTASEPLRDPNNTSNPAVPDVAAAEPKSNEPPKGKTSKTRTTISATNEVAQTLLDNSKSKKAAPRMISQLTECVTSSTRGMRKSKVQKDSPNLENENPLLPTDDSSGVSVNSFDDCDSDVKALLDIVTTPDDTSKQDARELHSTVGGLRKTKNKPEDNQLTEEPEDTSFFGFNEQEIEEGQQSTSLRLSQSAEVVPMQSPPQSGAKKKPSPPAKGKKQNPDTNWKKNSSSSLKNWLTTSHKSTEQGDGKVQKEINSSIPLKKRRARDQNLDNVKDLAQGDTCANEASREVESTQPSTPEPDDCKGCARQGKRKSLPGKKDESDAGDQTGELKSPVKTNRRTKRKRSSDDEERPKTEPAAKKSHLLPKAGQLAFERRKLGRPSKQESPRVAPVTPRERKYKNDTEFNPRLLLITQKEEIKNDEPLIDPDMQTAPTSKDDLQCALCMGYAPKKKWFLHISNHYGIGWVMGDPPPLNIKSRPSVLNYMVEFFKNSRVKGLNCRICKRQRRSALGLLTHLEQCCLTEDELKGSRVVCEHCRHEYSKSSIPVHLRTCPELLKKTKAAARAEPKVVNKVGGEDDVLSNTGRLKRKSVIKAESKLKNLDDSEFIPDEVIKHIPPPRLDLYPSTWRLEIESFGKAFCVQKKCPFTASTVDELVQHSQMDVCQFMEKVGYKCMKCKFHSIDIEPVRLHVVEKHSPQPARDFECSGDEAEFGSESSSDSISSGVDENDEDGSTVDGEEQKRKRKKRTKKMRVRIKTHQSQKDFKKLLPDREFDIAHKVKRWYEKFINDNYSTEALFDFATPSVDCQTDSEGYEAYLPKSPISMKFVLGGFKGFVKEFGKTQIAPESWQTLERLKGTGLANEHAAYLGGPVKSFAWAPLEPHPASKTQYLAVATRKQIDKFSKFKQPKQSRVLINILKYSQNDANVISGGIHFAFPIDAGPVHCVEFLPSGGYAPNLNRLGLIAVASVASEIKIYSLPLEVENSKGEIFPIIRLEPSLELCLEMADSPSKYSEQYRSQCMSVAWSQTAGHNYVIGGYLNGFVAIWDIAEEDDNLNRFLVNGLRKFVPVTYFWTMDNRIKHVVPHYDMNGLRWLGICNQNRKIFLYDLRELTNPVLFYAETTKNICNSLDWPIVWENPSCGHGDAMPSHGKCINTMSPMSLVFVNRRFDKFCCGVNDISFNPWRNLYAGAGDNGDIHVTPLREAVLDVGLRMKIDEKAMSSLDIVSLDGSAVNKNLSDGVGLLEPGYKQKYGLVFGAIQRIVGSKHREMYADIRIPPLNMARLMRINQLRFNPNRSADCLLAVGYENGFVRVIQSDWHKTP